MRSRWSLAFTMIVAALTCTRVYAAETCTTSFATVDLSSQWTIHPCQCFDKMPRETKIYLVDQYEIVDGNSMTELPPETVFSCNTLGLAYVLPGSVQREHVAATAKVRYARAAAEMVFPSLEAQTELNHRLRNGTARFERLR